VIKSQCFTHKFCCSDHFHTFHPLIDWEIFDSLDSIKSTTDFMNFKKSADF